MIALLAIVASCVVTAPAQAATALPGIALSPAIQDRVLGPKDGAVRFTVQIANDTEQPVRFALSSRDFTALNQSGGLAFLNRDAGRANQGHGLSGSLQLDPAELTLPAKSSKVITATVTNVAQLAPGGHYAAVIASVVPAAPTKTNNQVALNQAVSSLLFLETAGTGSKSLQLLKPLLSKLSFSLPTSLNLVFKSTGNTQTVPRGLATIERGSHTLQQGIINENSSLLLPGSTRLLPTILHGDQHPFWPGRYVLRVQYRYEGSLGVSEYEKSFLYINVPGLIAAIAASMVLILGAFRVRNYWKRHGAPSVFKIKKVHKITTPDSDNNHKKGRVMDITRPKK